MSFSSFTGVPCISFTTSSSNLQYVSYPTCSMWPDCISPRRLPAPLISKSLIAILKPEPNSVNSFIAFNLLSATSDNSLSLLYVIYAYPCLSERPTLPLIWYSWAKPNLSAFSTIIVFAFGISIPDSNIVVQTNTSILCSIKSCMMLSISLPVIFPCANSTFASGTNFDISSAFLIIFSTLLNR